MATKIIEEAEPTVAQRIGARVDSRLRSALLLAAASAIIALAPVPWASIGVVALVLVAFELGKRR